MIDKTCLSYWFPRLGQAWLPVPKTDFFRTGCELLHLLDGKMPDGYDRLLDDLRRSVDALGSPCFLRTGQTSGKHNWKRTCFLSSPENLPTHVGALVEYSACAGFFGLPCDVWAVREMLPVRPVAVLPRYGDMPLVREARCFVRAGEVVCHHEYWPPGAIAEGFHELPDPLPDASLSESQWGEALALARRVADVFRDDGAWSVDLLETDRGWYVTDMAEAHHSFHWDGCPRAVEFQRPSPP